MIAVKERIIKAYNDTRYSNLFFDDKNWYQRPHILFFGIFILFSTPMFLFTPDYYFYYIIIWSILLIIGLYTIMNPINKKIVKNKFNLEVDEGILPYWATLEFREYQLEKFYSELVEKKFLLENMKM